MMEINQSKPSIYNDDWIIITNEAARIEREKEAKCIPQHPRVEMLEVDLLRAIRILNQAGYKVIKEER